MTVRELMEACEEHIFIDVIIWDKVYDSYTDTYDDDIVAMWLHENHDDWYCGSLDYFSTRDENELVPYFKREVKSFTMINTVELDKTPKLYITVK